MTLIGHTTLFSTQYMYAACHQRVVDRVKVPHFA
jgi:hypothetical protein